MPGTSSLAGFSAVVEINATLDDSPWNRRVTAAVSARVPRGTTGRVVLATYRLGGMVGASVTAASAQVTSGVRRSGRDVGLQVEVEFSGVEITIADTISIVPPTVIRVPRPVKYFQQYEPATDADPRRVAGRVRDLYAEATESDPALPPPVPLLTVSANWRGAFPDTDTLATDWGGDALRAAGLDPDVVFRDVRNFVQGQIFGIRSLPLFQIRVTDAPPVVTPTPSSMPTSSTIPVVLDTAKTFAVRAKVLSGASGPWVVALLIESNTRLQRVGLHVVPERPDPANYVTRHLGEREDFTLLVDSNVLFAAMAHLLTELFVFGTATFTPSGTPYSLAFFPSADTRPSTRNRPEGRFVVPGSLVPASLRPDLSDGLRMMQITAPGIAPRNAMVRRMDLALDYVTHDSSRLRFTMRLTDPNDVAGVIWGIEAYLEWTPTTLNGQFIWQLYAPPGASPVTITERYAGASAFWWLVAAAAFVAAAASFGAASGAAVAAAATVITGIAVASFIVTVIAGTIAAVLTGVSLPLLGSALEALTTPPGPGSTGFTIPPLGTSLIPPEILTWFGGPVRFLRAVLDDLTVTGQLPPPDVAAHAEARDLAATDGQAFDLDTARILSGVTPSTIPLGADLLWWNAGGTLSLQNGPATGAAVLRAESLVQIREEALAAVTFPARLWLDIGSIPRFDSPPPADTTGLPVRPLFLGVRTSEGRFAKCAIWRDLSDRLHVQFATYETLVPRLAISQSRTATRGDEVERGWDPAVRAEYVRYRAAWRFDFRASWDRLPRPVTLTWFLNGVEVRDRIRILLPSMAVMGAEVVDGVLSVSTPTGEPASIEVRAVARDALGLELQTTVTIETDGTVTDYGESDLLWAQRQLRAVTPFEAVPFRPPLDMGDPAASVTRSPESAFTDAINAGMGFSVDDARAFVGLGPIDGGRF